MGEHHVLETEPGWARIAGRGAVAATAVLAVGGTGAGLANASPGHHDPGDSTESADSTRVDCDVDGGSVGGLLGDLGLGHSTDQLCSSDRSSSGGNDASDSSERSRGSHSSTSGSSDNEHDGNDGAHGSTQAQQSTPSQSSASTTPAASSTPVNPDDIPPAPGETKVIDIPDRT